MEKDNNDSGWKDLGNGVQMRTFKIPPMKPFSMEDMKNTWHMSIPDGNGNVTNTFGRWENGKMIEEHRETIPDPLEQFLLKR